jgi:signal transduction histidine kinase
LGLAICEEIIKEHSGRIGIESEVGKGSTFFISFPVIERNETDEQGIRSSLGGR